MTENITQMRARHKKELDKLQTTCLHKKVSDWMPYHWAPGHSCGEVKICYVCEVIIEKSPAFLAMTEPADFSGRKEKGKKK